jgi:hypothetical protein
VCPEAIEYKRLIFSFPRSDPSNGSEVEWRIQRYEASLSKRGAELIFPLRPRIALKAVF